MFIRKQDHSTNRQIVKVSFRFLLILLFFLVTLSACSSSKITPTPETVPTFRLIGSQGNANFVVIEKATSSDRDGLIAIARKICKGESICIVFFWDDIDKVAYSLPMTDAQVNTRVAAYNLNQNTGLDRLLICSEDGC